MRNSLRVQVSAAIALLSTASHAGMFPSSPFSNSAAGTTSAAFLKAPAGARPEALAGAFTAVADNSEAIFWNPAGLARLQAAGTSDVALNYNMLLAGANATAISYAKPIRERGVLGVGLTYFSAGSIQGYDALQNQTGTFAPYDLAVTGAFATKFQSVGVGAGLKLIRSVIDSASGMSAAVDAGVQIPRVADIGDGPVDFGASLLNLGPPMKIGGESDPLPMRFAGGFAWHLTPEVQTILEGHMPVDQNPYAALAGEVFLRITDKARGALRLGYNTGRLEGIEGLTGLTAGFGLDVHSFRIDYAWVPFGDLGTTNRISLGFKF
ncbi:MAG: PorV/PorQ family protein [Elusimicrobia bacterium]|nr:PorV/PorQ family protein [Elusimicrobiota bacterium]